MAKKNFKSATEDIFGEYQQPTSTAVISDTAEEKEYELFLLSVDKAYLDRLKVEAQKSKKEVKDVLDTILAKHFYS